jgi:hypothetical protein
MTMHITHRRLAVPSAWLCTAIVLQACGTKSSSSTTTSTAPDRIRGTVQSLDSTVLTVATPDGSVRVQLAPSTPVATVVQSDRAHITSGTFLGIASVTAPDGSQRAAEVTVFPESMRGTGEGSYAWDLPGVGANSKMTNGSVSASRMTNGTVSASRMTNGTVSASRMTNGTVAGQAGGSLTLTYKDGTSQGSQTIAIPPDIPVVALQPGATGDLQPGAHVVVFASRTPGGVLTANRVLAGKNGVVPPM